MNRRDIFTVAIVLTTAAILTSGCTSNMAGKTAGGAFGGALSASFVGAMTDLIIDGKVNTDRLARNATSGALAGGMAGAAYGHQQDMRAERERQMRQAPPPKADADDKALMKQIGPDNFDALVSLLYGQHEAAFKSTLKGAESKHTEYVEAAYIIQALIDLERKNENGVTEALKAFIEANAEASDLKETRQGLDELHRELVVARRVKGIPSGK